MENGKKAMEIQRIRLWKAGGRYGQGARTRQAPWLAALRLLFAGLMLIINGFIA